MKDILASRRSFIRSAGAVSALLPTASALASGADLESGKARNLGFNSSAGNSGYALNRNFSNVKLELVRLLKEVSEVEHSLMLQYLYAGFSLKNEYSSLMGTGAPDSTSFIGIAVQEMQHLGSVNRLMVELGAAPNLSTQDFPYEYDIYPFRMSLEPLTRSSVAKYAYCESPVLTVQQPVSGAGGQFEQSVRTVLGEDLKINRVGSVYEVLLAMVDELDCSGCKLDTDYWKEELRRIMDEGEEQHFAFFRSVFTGENIAFKNNPQWWRAQDSQRSYPAFNCAVDPTAYVGHPNTIGDASLRELAWVGNLYYWSTLILLDLYYREQDNDIRSMVIMMMMGPLKSIGRELASKGCGLPFDRLSLGSSPCCGPHYNLEFSLGLMAEIARATRNPAVAMPGDYSHAVETLVVAELSKKLQSYTPSTVVRT